MGTWSLDLSEILQDLIADMKDGGNNGCMMSCKNPLYCQYVFIGTCSMLHDTMQSVLPSEIVFRIRSVKPLLDINLDIYVGLTDLFVNTISDGNTGCMVSWNMLHLPGHAKRSMIQ